MSIYIHSQHIEHAASVRILQDRLLLPSSEIYSA